MRNNTQSENHTRLNLLRYRGNTLQFKILDLSHLQISSFCEQMGKTCVFVSKISTLGLESKSVFRFSR